MLGFARRASFGAFTLDRQSCLSGGGPPLGWPLIITLSPERTLKNKAIIKMCGSHSHVISQKDHQVSLHEITHKLKTNLQLIFPDMVKLQTKVLTCFTIPLIIWGAGWDIICNPTVRNSPQIQSKKEREVREASPYLVAVHVTLSNPVWRVHLLE